MPRLTLRTLLAYIDDTLDSDQTRSLGRKVAASDEAKQLIERIKKVTRRRGLRSPTPDGTEDDVADPNTVAEYLSDKLDSEQLKHIETTCLESDVHLAEVAACHQILTLVLTEPVRVPPSANQRMYRLVESPASDHNRKPGKTIPVGGVTPPTPDQTETDDPDAALLLGLKRYSAADSWVGRLGLVGAVGGIVVFLALAVLMALPPAAPERPETSREVSYALATPSPTPLPKTDPTPGPAPAPLPKPDPTPGPAPLPPPIVPVIPDVKPPMGDPGPGLGGKVAAPLPGRDVVGKMLTPNVIVLRRAPVPVEGAFWLAVNPAESKVFASDPLMALPGYKAKVELDTGAVVHLWGNVREQLQVNPLVLESRVRFHPSAPGSGFDADLTLEAGRIYLTTTKATGSKIRVRFASEIWDVALTDNTTEVLVQTHTAFVPGTPYRREGGELPRTEARLMVTRGTAAFNAPNRAKKFDLPIWSEIGWNSKTDTLNAPAIAQKEEQVDRVGSEIAIGGELGTAIQRILTDAAQNFTNPSGIRILLEGRMENVDDPKDLPFRRILATYAYGTIVDGPEAHSMIGRLWDALGSTDVFTRRMTVVNALSPWFPRDPKNTALFVEAHVAKAPTEDEKKQAAKDADLIAQLLRGYGSPVIGPTAGDTSKLDELVDFLDPEKYDLIPVREAALGNLITYYDFEASKAGAVKGPPPDFDVGNKGKEYDKFLEAWKMRAALIKTWMIERKKGMVEKK